MATMNFNTTNSTFRQLLGNGLIYRVPPFQRDYSWTEDEWDDLWQDMVALFAEDSEPSHYMGYLVLQSADSKSFDIIDGQQRITTISLLVLACLARLHELSEADLDAGNNRQRMEQLRSSYIGYLDPVSLISRSKLRLNRHNDHYYQNYLVPLERLPQRGLNASEHQLRKAFNWLRDRLKGRFAQSQNSGRDLAAFLDELVDRLFFTVITVTDELNAFKVFETLNARGVRLSSTDLLKNYLFSIISSKDVHERELKNLEERWERIVGLLGNEAFPEFLHVYWNSRNRLVRKADLFKTIRRSMSTREQAFSLLRELDHFASVYATLRDPGDTGWRKEESQALRQLAMFNVRQPLAMLMACHAAYFEADRNGFTRIMRAVAVVSFRYNVICNLQAHEQERLYNAIAIRVSGQDAVSVVDVVTALREVYPPDERFKTAFADKEFRTTNSRNKKVVRYILFEMERQRSGSDFDVESAQYSIEHILPEHPSEAWNYIDDTLQERLIYRIGNMTPLETNRNRDLGNAGYEEKQGVYQQSDFGITQAVAEHYEVWDEQKINARQKRLADLAVGIWKL